MAFLDTIGEEFEVVMRRMARQAGMLGDIKLKGKEGDSAAAWFGSDDRESPLSFENICDVHGLDPDYVRRKLAERVTDPARREAVLAGAGKRRRLRRFPDEVVPAGLMKVGV